MRDNALQLQLEAHGVAVLTLNRPRQHNALSSSLIAQLAQMAQRLEHDAAVRLVLLNAAGESFCAGADIAWMRENATASRDQRLSEARKLAYMLRDWARLSKPLIARVHGAAYGGGIGIIAVCDSVIAATSARFAFSETRLGLIPATISPYVIARIGSAAARHFMLSAAAFDATTAKALQLVSCVTPDNALDATVAGTVNDYLQAAPDSISRCKQLLSDLAPPITEALIEDTIEHLADTWETDSAREGLAAFFEHRKPAWAQAIAPPAISPAASISDKAK